NHLLLRGVHAAGEDPRFHGRAIAAQADHGFAIDAAVETSHQARTLRVGADDAGDPCAPAERRDIVYRVARTAGDHFRGVVLQDQYGRFARHARHLAVNELIGDDVADDEHALAGKSVDEAQQTLPVFSLAR